MTDRAVVTVVESAPDSRTRAPVTFAIVVALLLGSVCQVAAQRPDISRRIAVTFDDLPKVAAGPGADAPEYVTEGILSALGERGVPAIGFVNEGQLTRDQLGDARGRRLLERWVEEGHLLGNHTYAHTWLYEAGSAAFIEDIDRGERVWRPLMEARGVSPVYFRHPRLNTGRTMGDRVAVERHLERRGYVVAPVSIDNNEYLFANAYARSLERGEQALADRIGDAYVAYMGAIFEYYEEQSRRILGREPAQILLLHANRLNADRVGEVLDLLLARGYAFISLPEALEDAAYGRPDEYVGRQGITWLHRWAITAGHPGSAFSGEPEVPRWVLEAGGA